MQSIRNLKSCATHSRVFTTKQMPTFNRAIALVSLPSSNIILGFVFGDDFCTDGHCKHTNSSQSSSQLSAERTTSNAATVPKWIHGGNTERVPFFPQSPITELSCKQKGPSSSLHPPSFALLQQQQVGRNPVDQAVWGFPSMRNPNGA